MDPLRPFATLIRSWWASKPRATGAPDLVNTPHQTGSPAAVESRLRIKLRNLSVWQADRAREIFVEAVLLNELGSELSTDPEFHALVREVSANLGSVQTVSLRLDAVLQELQRNSEVG